MKTIILILSLTALTGCLLSKAENIKTMSGTMVKGQYSCRYLTTSQFNCGVDLHECVVSGRPVQKIICATDVVVERGY